MRQHTKESILILIAVAVVLPLMDFLIETWVNAGP
jgi:hypothetical protein